MQKERGGEMETGKSKVLSKFIDFILFPYNNMYGGKNIFGFFATIGLVLGILVWIVIIGAVAWSYLSETFA